MRHFAPEHLLLWIIPEAHSPSNEENQFAPSLQTSHKLDGIKHKTPTTKPQILTAYAPPAFHKATAFPTEIRNLHAQCPLQAF